jgi:hypothetical protein
MKQEMVKIEASRIGNTKEAIIIISITFDLHNNYNQHDHAKKRLSSTGCCNWAGEKVTGAIISKKVQGAAIYGVVGAGVGAGTGAIIDGSKIKFIRRSSKSV